MCILSWRNPLELEALREIVVLLRFCASCAQPVMCVACAGRTQQRRMPTASVAGIAPSSTKGAMFGVNGRCHNRRGRAHLLDRNQMSFAASLLGLAAALLLVPNVAGEFAAKPIARIAFGP